MSDTTYTVILLILGVFATHRVSLMLSSEEGPLAIFARMRRRVPPKTNPGRGIRCFRCVSVFVSAAITIYYYALGICSRQLAPIIWLAISSAAICIHSKFTSDA